MIFSNILTIISLIIFSILTNTHLRQKNYDAATGYFCALMWCITYFLKINM